MREDTVVQVLLENETRTSVSCKCARNFQLIKTDIFSRIIIITMLVHLFFYSYIDISSRFERFILVTNTCSTLSKHDLVNLNIFNGKKTFYFDGKSVWIAIRNISRNDVDDLYKKKKKGNLV